MLRYFACQEDLSHESPDAPLPDAVASGAELEPGWGDLAIGLGEDHGVDRAAEDSEGSAVREQQPLVLPDR